MPCYSAGSPGDVMWINGSPKSRDPQSRKGLQRPAQSRVSRLRQDMCGSEDLGPGQAGRSWPSNSRAMCELGVAEPALSSTSLAGDTPPFCTGAETESERVNSFPELHSTFLCARPEPPFKEQEHQS